MAARSFYHLGRTSHNERDQLQLYLPVTASMIQPSPDDLAETPRKRYPHLFDWREVLADQDHRLSSLPLTGHDSVYLATFWEEDVIFALVRHRCKLDFYPSLTGDRWLRHHTHDVVRS